MECHTGGNTGSSALPIVPPLCSSCMQLFQRIIYDEAISDMHKNNITLIFSEADKRLVDGSDEHLTVLDLALRISAVLSGV